MKASLALCVAAFALAPLVPGEVVEEETWYSADGKVVKKVKRTLSGADQRKDSDWEPAWVLRERNRGVRNASYSAPQRYWRGSNYGSGCYSSWVSGYYYPRSYYGRSGFTGYLRAGRGTTRWGLGYRTPGLSLFLTR